MGKYVVGWAESWEFKASLRDLLKQWNVFLFYLISAKEIFWNNSYSETHGIITTKKLGKKRAIDHGLAEK